MLSFTRRRLIVLFLFVALVVFAGFRFGQGSRAAKPGNSVMLGGPLITATMTAAPVTDIGTNGAFVNPGDTLEYTVTLNNTGDTANSVVFTDNLADANLTLLPATIKASPIAFDETFPVTGNVRIQKTSGVLLSNDIRPTTGNNTGLTITALAGDTTSAFAGTSAQGGQVTAASGDGSFEYNPPPGFEGADSFTYTVTDPDGLTATGTVNLTVADMIWFINPTAAAGGDGRITNPFNTVTAFNSTAADEADDIIFLYSGTHAAANFTLLANQQLIGQGVDLATVTGITPPAGSDPLPAASTNPEVDSTAGNTVTLSTNNTIRGLNLRNSVGIDLTGSGYGTLTVTAVGLTGTGRPLNLTTGALAATFTGITTTAATGGQGINIAGATGLMTVTGGTTIAGSTTQGILVGTTTANINFGNTSVTGGTDGISLQNNSGGTRTFGTLGLTNNGATGFLHGAGGGVVNVTGLATITNPTGSCIDIRDSTTAVTFANVAATQCGATGVNLGGAGDGNSGNITFADLDVAPDNGVAAINFIQNTGTITSTSGTIVSNGGTHTIQIGGGTTLAMVLDSISSTNDQFVGININTASGNFTSGTTTITNPGNGVPANGIGIQILSMTSGTLNFGNTTINGSGVLGLRLGTSVADGNSANIAFADLDIAPDANTGAISAFSNTGTITSTSGDVSSTGATAILGNATQLNLVLTSTTSSGAANAISLTGVSGTSNFGIGTLTATAAPFLISGGTCSTTYSGNITQANNSPLVSITGHGTGTVTFLNGPGTLSATNGTGLQFDNADGLYNFNGITTLNGGDAGIDIINGSAGSFTFNGSTSITNPSGIAFRQDASNASVAYSGTITKTNNANNAIDINGKTGGTTNFSGAITATTTTAAAIDLTNTGGSVNFSGGMTVNTTSGAGFNATGTGQTVNVCDDNPCNPAATGVLVNSLTSTTGAALNVANSTIGANNLEFRSISSNGSASGIVLNTTGTSGGLKVKGDGGGSNNGSGGTIQNTTSPGVSLNSTSGVALNYMIITAAGDDGISGASVTDFVMNRSNITNNGNALNEDGVDFGGSGLAIPNPGLFGTASITNSQFTGNYYNQFTVRNSTNTANLTVTNNTFTGRAAENNNNDGLFFEALTTASITANVQSNSFSANKGDHFQAAGVNSGSLNVTFSTNTLTGGHSSALGQGITINAATGVPGWNGRIDYDINGNTINGAISNGITVALGTSAAGAVFDGFVRNNTIGTSGSSLSCSTQANGVYIDARGNGTHNSAVTGNTIRQCFDRGILSEAGDGDSILNLTIQSNIIDQQVDPGAREAFQTNYGITSTNVFGNADTNNVCLQFGGAGGLANTLSHGAGAPDDFRLRKRQEAAVRLPGYAGGNSQSGGDLAAVVAFVQTLNTGSAGEPGSASASGAGSGGITGYGGGAACTQPSLAPPSGSDIAWADTDPSDASSARASVESREIGGEIIATTTGWEPARAVASVDTIDAVIWQQAVAEAISTGADPVSDSQSIMAEIFEKMTSQISPTVYSQDVQSPAFRRPSGDNKEPSKDGVPSSPEAGTVTVNGSGSGFTIPTNKGTTITFRAVISTPTTPVNTFSVSNQGSVAATGMTTVLTDDPGVAGTANPTVTTVVQPPTITKSFTPANILLDQQSTLTITINNTNPAQAVTGITVTDVFPTNVVVATPLDAATTCGAGTLQDSDGNTLAPGDAGIKLVGGTRNAVQSCTVTVKVRGTIGGTYVNTTGNVASFEGFTGTTASSTLNVSVFTASELSISGRVLTSEGRGIRNARVLITGNSLSQPISVFTGVNGTYSVEGLAAGETYIVTVQSRRFEFESPSRVVTLIDNVTDADFTGLPGTSRNQ